MNAITKAALISLFIISNNYATPFHLFGYPLNSPIGIGACPLTQNTQIIQSIAHKGFDIITYKTIRTHAQHSHPAPHMFRADSSSVTDDQIGDNLHLTEIQPLTIDDTLAPSNNFSIVNSFGISSQSPAQTIADIKKTKALLSQGQLLIVSVYGTGKSKSDLVADFVAAAKIGVAGGAEIVELNFSCPNVGKKLNFIYENAELVYEICKAVSQEIDHIPCIIKVGVFKDINLMKDVFYAAHNGGARGVCGINSIPMRVIDYEGDSIFEGRELAGLSGAAIFNAALEFTKNARTIIDTENLNLKLFAVGGVMQPEHFDKLLIAGADIVQCATGALWNNDLAMQYHALHAPQKTVSAEKAALIKDFFAIGAIQMKETVFKSGMISPSYFDMRLIMSHPDILKRVASLLTDSMNNNTYDVICGVPYAAIPLATTVALEAGAPLIMQRKEIKSHGTQKEIEGNYGPGTRCAIIEDVITTGGSILESVRALERNGLVVKDIYVIIDREQKGIEYVQKHGYTVHPLFTHTEILQVLLADGLISYQQRALIKQFCARNTATT